MPALMAPPPVTLSVTTRLVLRDGSTAGVRLASPSDRETMRRFFRELSPESRRLRFLAAAQAPESLIERLCDNSDPRKAVTLVVCRQGPQGIHFVGVGSYFASSATAAEVAFAVEDNFHGKGIATALLERLAAIGIEHGFLSFDASVLVENQDMLEVFRDSGFAVETTTGDGCVDVRLSLERSAASLTASDARDRDATIASLQSILQPRAVAVIGTSRNPAHLGRQIFDNLIASGFTGPVYAVNRSATELNGRRCLSSARELPPGVDLAVIAVNRDAVLPAVDDCAASGVKSLIVISAGFAETGAEGARLQLELVEKVRGYGMRMVGPNCMGVLNAAPDVRLNASFAESLPSPGRIALASQSGGLGLGILSLASSRQLGLSTFVSLGNKADVSGNDLLQYGESDPATSVILLYLESFGNPRRFAQLARRISRTKPIVVVKAGRTPAGIRAAASHTAGMASGDTSVEGLFRQSGVIRADTIDEMFDIAACLDAQPLPAGRRVAILTNSGGPGILAADACAAGALEVRPLASGRTNPVDLIASACAEDYRKSLEALLTADDVDAVIVIYTTIDRCRTEEILAAIREGVAAARRSGSSPKPVLLCTMASATISSLRLPNETIPVYQFPEQAARALAKATAYAEWRRQPQGNYLTFERTRVAAVRKRCQDIVRARGNTWLTPDELAPLLHAFGLHATPGVVAETADEAVALARVFGFPVAAKMVSADLVHKTDVGGVKLSLINETAVRAAFDDFTIRARTLGTPLDGVLVQPMVAGGTEIIAGLTRDPLFGPLVAFGLGGIHVEALRDVAFRIAPLTDRDADDLLHSIRGFALLEGHRTKRSADLDALRDLLLRISYLSDQVPEVLEIEFNPIMAHPQGEGYEIVDARARVGRPDADFFAPAGKNHSA